MDSDRSATYAARAVRAHAAMQTAFDTFGGRYRREGPLGALGVSAHLWPFIRAFVATLDLAGLDPSLVPGFDADAQIARHHRVLELYWAPRPPAAYASDRRLPALLRWLPVGGSRYHDDNAWVALALIQLERMRPGSVDLDRVEALWRFAVSGWARGDLEPRGGVFWVEQGCGAGRRNHDRNTVSCAPNAEVGLHLGQLRPDSLALAAPAVTPGAMFVWPYAHLDAGGDGGGLFFDKIRGDGSIDRALWSYNQGSMVGAAVLLARAGHPDCLARAEEIARRALTHYAGGALERQPVEFNAILLRNLLLLHHATADGGLRRAILATFAAYADWLWSTVRDPADRFVFGHRGRHGFTLLGQSGAVQILALLAWDPAHYGLLA